MFVFLAKGCVERDPQNQEGTFKGAATQALTRVKNVCRDVPERHVKIDASCVASFIKNTVVGDVFDVRQNKRVLCGRRLRGGGGVRGGNLNFSFAKGTVNSCPVQCKIVWAGS